MLYHDNYNQLSDKLNRSGVAAKLLLNYCLRSIMLLSMTDFASLDILYCSKTVAKLGYASAGRVTILFLHGLLFRLRDQPIYSISVD